MKISSEKKVPVLGRTKEGLIIQHPLDGSPTFIHFKEMEGLLTVTSDGRYLIADENGRLSKMCEYILIVADSEPELTSVIHGMTPADDSNFPVFERLKDLFFEKFPDAKPEEFVSILTSLSSAAGVLRRYREVMN